MSRTRSSSPKAPATEPRWLDAALLLCAHGVRGEAGVAWDHAASLAALDGFASVGACCVHGEPRLEDALAGIAAARSYLVPLLMAEGYTNDALAARHLAARSRLPGASRLCRPVGSHPGLAALIVEAARERCRARGWPPTETALLLVGHGTPRHARSNRSLYRHGEAIAGRGAFAQVACAFLEDEPSLDAALRGTTARHRVVVGHFADAGPHGADDVSGILAALAPDAAYAGPVGCQPGLVELILDRVRQEDAASLAA